MGGRGVPGRVLASCLAHESVSSPGLDHPEGFIGVATTRGDGVVGMVGLDVGFGLDCCFMDRGNDPWTPFGSSKGAVGGCGSQGLDIRPPTRCAATFALGLVARNTLY